MRPASPTALISVKSRAAPPVPPVTGCTMRPAFESRTPPASDVTTPQASRHAPGRIAATIGRTLVAGQDGYPDTYHAGLRTSPSPRHSLPCRGCSIPRRHGHAHLAHSHNLPRRGRVVTQIRQPRRSMPCPVDRARRCAGQSLPHANQSPTSGGIDRMAGPRTQEWMICAAPPARAAQLSAARNRRYEWHAPPKPRLSIALSNGTSPPWRWRLHSDACRDFCRRNPDRWIEVRRP